MHLLILLCIMLLMITIAALYNRHQHIEQQSGPQFTGEQCRRTTTHPRPVHFCHRKKMRDRSWPAPAAKREESCAVQNEALRSGHDASPTAKAQHI